MSSEVSCYSQTQAMVFPPELITEEQWPVAESKFNAAQGDAHNTIPVIV